MDPYLASLLLFAGNFAIRGWAFCHGQIMSIAQNTALFSVIGVTYGGNGSTTFALPDLRGRVPVGAGQGPGLSNYILGERAGQETVTLLTTQMPAHTHAINLDQLTMAQPASANVGTSGVPGPGLGPAQLGKIGSGPNAQAVPAYGTPDGATTLSPIQASGALNPDPAGNGQAHENRMPYLGMHYLIALEGIFPTRD